MPRIPVLDELRHLPFSEVPDMYKARAFGVTYVHLKDDAGGELYVTPYAWTILEHVLPRHWYEDRRYIKVGHKLPGGTGAVYKVPSLDDPERSRDLVVKFSRVAQDVPIFVPADFEDRPSQTALDAARFNSPFEEFGLLEQLREDPAHPDLPRIRTKRPLAIYSPPKHYKLWQLGRHRALFNRSRQELESDQAALPEHEHIDLEIERDYISLFEWLKGENAEELYDQGLLTEKELKELTHRVVVEMRNKGFEVLDTKPKHFILRRRRRDGSLIRRDGDLVYGVVDFELLRKIPPPASIGD